MVMNKYPIVEMLAFFSRYRRSEKPGWEKSCVRKLKRVRSCHSKTEGGVRTSYYSLETKNGEIYNLEFNEEELVWTLNPGESHQGLLVDRVLALVKQHKHTPSRAHRVIPYLFEVVPREKLNDVITGPAPPLIERVQPFRFQGGKLESAQVTEVVTRHLENVMVTKHLHYVVKTDLQRFFHLVFILDEQDWRFMAEVDEEFFFVR